jgi:hypothetical protein
MFLIFYLTIHDQPKAFKFVIQNLMLQSFRLVELVHHDLIFLKYKVTIAPPFLTPDRDT